MVGRQMSRSNTTSHHKRQYSENFLDALHSGKWHQSTQLTASQDFGFHGGSRMSRKSPEKGLPHDLSSGLLDLHSFDTELLTEVPSQYGAYSFQQVSGFVDSESHPTISKATNKAPGVPEYKLLRSFSVDKERASNVAKIKVVVRKRPLNKKEIGKKEQDIIDIEPNSYFLTVHETKLKVDLTEYLEKHEFVFDAILNENVSNDEVYSETVEPIVPLIFQRTKATCFAYGQTGSGKTYTMQPLPIRASQDILKLMHYAYRNQGYQLFVSFFEIYGGKVFDLLNDRKKLYMREDGKQQVCIVGLQEYRVSDVEIIKEFIEKGNATRSTGTTGANEESSRSHAVLQLSVKKSVDGSETKPARLVGKLSFIDLAGSERGADTTDNDKQTRIEGAEINKSLLALKECIRALDNDQGHIPFRGSKLTEVLRDSFVGDSRTVMISCISPGSGSCEHTLNTLRYADRVKSLSKCNSSKRDPALSLNIRDSTVLPLSSMLPMEQNLESNIPDIPNDKNRVGWPQNATRDTSAHFAVDRVPSGRTKENLTASMHSSYPRGQRVDGNVMAEEDFDYSGDVQENVTLMKKDLSSNDANNLSADADLSALLKEEEDLVSAHKRQVEETIDIVREEMNLLFHADQPGNHLDGYISKLDTILSQKAAGILQLQNQLAQFQRRMKELDVLVPSND